MLRKTSFLVALLAFSCAARAQSNVTLYGVVDDSLMWNSNAGGKQLFGTQAGGHQSERWGLRGSEDLGAGAQAFFTLENGFDNNSGKSGQGGREFGRQAFVGLGNSYGRLSLGRQYDSVVDFLGPFEVGDQWAGFTGAHPGDLDNFNNTYRTNNSIKYASPTYAGFNFGGLYSLGGVAGDASRDQVWSLGAGYANGSFNGAIAYLNARNPNEGFWGANVATAAASSSNVTSPVYSGFTSAHTYQVIGAAGSYVIDKTTVGVTYSNTKFYDLGNSYASPYHGTATLNNVEVNAKYQFTPSLLAGVAYDYTRGSSVAAATGSNEGAKYHQFALSLDYFLSRRTDLYLIGIYQKASGTDSRDRPAIAAISGLTASSNDHQGVVLAGVRHKF
jgi:predicted porin